ncbi:MAG: hypothetical protein H7Y12_13955 [Sphingobacteriaceae bacterium]|nr:hypothetical protein [Cytophagaceae bacterium]
MATSATTDFLDDFKGYAQGLLLGSFAFGSVFPLALKMANDLFPGMGTGTGAQTYHIVVFFVVNLVYFVLPLLFGLLAWGTCRQDSPDDALFRVDFLEKSTLPNTARWRGAFRQKPLWILLILVVLGSMLMYPWRNFHGPGQLFFLLLCYLSVTGLFIRHARQFYRDGLPPQLTEDIFFANVVRRVRTQWIIALAVSVFLFGVAYFSFFREHEHHFFTPEAAKGLAREPEDKDLTIRMPFAWQETASRLDKLYVKPIKGKFDSVAMEANLLLSTSLDYNDIELRQQPDTALLSALKRSRIPIGPAWELRKQFLVAHDTLRRLIGRDYVGSSSLDTLLDQYRRSRWVEELLGFYHLDTQDSEVRINLLLANQHMPLADNLAEAAGGLKEAAEKHSRKLLADWIKISRIKGLFLLFTFLNMLICGWFVIRLANEVHIREKSELLPPKPAGKAAKAEGPSVENLVPAPTTPPRSYRELTNLKYFISLTILLILPLFRVVDESTVRADRPFWFLNLPELIGNVVQPLPNGYNSQSNFVQNQEVISRLNQLGQGVKKLDSTSTDQQKITRDLQKATRDAREVLEELKLR